MLAEDNEIFTRVGVGTPGGQLMRQFWLPVMLSSELPEPDCSPVRVRLLGEDLVAFRDTDGAVGLFDIYCAHRGASLYFGRNEGCGLRCVYHGWKYDVRGNVVDMPHEPRSTVESFKTKVKQKAYPCVERARVVWAYLGPRDPAPPLPAFPFMDLPDDHVVAMRNYAQFNWAQGMEGGVDPSHPMSLHASVTAAHRAQLTEQLVSMKAIAEHYWASDNWDYDATETEAGMMVVAFRPADGEQTFWRVNHYLLPIFTMNPIESGESPCANISCWVPVDDQNTAPIYIRWHPLRPLTDVEIHGLVDQFGECDPGDPLQPGSQWLQHRNRRNDYLIDREVQRTRSATGIETILAQDQAIEESMGFIARRDNEHLGKCDVGIIAARRVFLRAAKALRASGTVPAGVADPDLFMRRGANKLLPHATTDWANALRDYYIARHGVNPAMP
jgi:phenylpropionate dioxygenase-like ring-hydroxylating dioxygenase large terminal subunit